MLLRPEHVWFLVFLLCCPFSPTSADLLSGLYKSVSSFFSQPEVRQQLQNPEISRQQRRDILKSISSNLLTKIISTEAPFLTSTIGLEDKEFDNDSQHQDHIRHKRETSFVRQSSDPLNDEIGVQRLRGLYPVARLCSNSAQQVLHFNTLQVHYRVFTICLTPSQLIIGELNGSLVNQTQRDDPSDQSKQFSPLQWRQTGVYHGHGFRKVDHFVSERKIFFVLARAGVGMPLLRLDLDSLDFVPLDQQTVSSDPSTISIWLPKTWKSKQQGGRHLNAGQTWNLAVANSLLGTSRSEMATFDARKKRSAPQEEESASSDVVDQIKQLNSSEQDLDASSSEMNAIGIYQGSFRSYISLLYFDSVSNYFDEYDRVTSFLVKDLCTFTINNYDYMLVVNYKAGFRHHQVDSELFKLDPHEIKWKSIQKIRTFGAVACEFFSLAGKEQQEAEHFLAIANNHDINAENEINYEVNSVIYKFYYDQFIPFQCISTVGAWNIRMVKSSNPQNDNLDDYLVNSNSSPNQRSASFTDANTGHVLAVASLLGVQLYQYNGWKFVLSGVQYTQQSMGPSLPVHHHSLYQMSLQHPSTTVNERLLNDILASGNLLYSFEYQGQLHLIASNRQHLSEVNTFRLQFQHENQLAAWYESSLSWCDKLVNRLSNEAQRPLVQMQSLLNQTHLIDSPDAIRLPQLHFKAGADFRLLSAPLVSDLSHRRNFSDALVGRLLGLDQLLKQLRSEQARLQQMLTSVLRVRSSTPQMVSSPIQFDRIEMHCGTGSSTCSAGQLNANNLNGRLVRQLSQRILRLDQDEKIWSKPSIQQLAADQIYVNGLVNGRRISDLVTRSGTHRLLAPIRVASYVRAENAQIDGTINGRNLRPDLVLLKTGNQTVRSGLQFVGPVQLQGDLYVTGPINDQRLTLNEIINSIVTHQSNVSVWGDKHFTGTFGAQELWLKGDALINGVDLPTLYQNLVWIDRDQTIAGNIGFGNVTIDANLNIGSTFNGIVFPNDDLVLSNSSTLILAPKRFLQQLQTDRAEIGRSLNGLPLVGGQLDLLLRNQPQLITGRKNFARGVHLGASSHVAGRVDGVKLQAFERFLQSLSDSRALNGTVLIHGDAELLQKLHVGGRVNGVRVPELLQKALPLNSTLLTGFQQVQIKSMQTPQVRTQTLNSVPVGELLLRNHPQVLRGRMHMKEGVLLTGAANVSYFNDLSLDSAARAVDSLLRDSSQQVSGHKIVQGDLYVGQLQTRNLNGLPMNQLFTLHTNQFVSAPIKFARTRIQQNIFVQNINSLNTLNNLPFEQLINGSLQYDIPQTVLAVKSFKTIQVPADQNLAVSLVNDVSLPKLLNRLVYRDGPTQVIFAPIEFKAPLQAQHTEFVARLGHFLPQYLLDGFVRNGLPPKYQLLAGSLHVQGNLTVVHDLQVDSGIVDAVHLPTLQKFAVRLDRPQILAGPVTFESASVLTGNVHVEGLLNGLRLPQDVALRGRINQTIYGRKRFRSMHVIQTLHLANSHFNDVNVVALCANSLRANNDRKFVFHFPTTVLGQLRTSLFYVNGSINRLDLQQVYNNLMLLPDQKTSQIVAGHKHFEQLNLHAPSLISNYGPLSGIDLRALLASYLSLSRPQKVILPVRFGSSVSVHHLRVQGSLHSSQLLKGLDLTDLAQNSLRSDRQQIVNAPLVFERPVQMDLGALIRNDTINKLRLNRDLALRNRPINVLQGHVQFTAPLQAHHVHTAADVDLQQIQDGAKINVQRFVRSAVFNNRARYEVTGRKHFHEVIVDDIQLNGPLNGLLFDANRLLVDGSSFNSTITGALRLRSDLLLDQPLQISGRVNGQRLDRLLDDLVLKGRQNVMTSSKHWDGGLVIDDLVVEGSVAGFNITQLAAKLDRPLVDFNGTARVLNLQSNHFGRISRSLEMLEDEPAH